MTGPGERREIDMAPPTEAVFASHEIALPDRQLVDLCHIVRAMVEHAVEQPQLIQDNTRVLTGIPHDNSRMPNQVRSALGPTRLNMLQLTFRKIEHGQSVLTIQADDLNRPGRHLTFKELATDRTYMLIEDNQREQMASVGQEPGEVISSEAVSTWLASQIGSVKRAEEFVNAHGPSALHTAADFLGTRATATHHVKVAGLVLPTGRTLSAHYTVSQANTGPDAPLLRNYTAWLTANHDPSQRLLPQGVYELTERLFVSFSPELGVTKPIAGNEDESPTSARVELEGVGAPKTSLTELVSEKAQAARSTVLESFHKASFELRAVT